MSSSDKAPPDPVGPSLGQAQHLADEADRAFLRLVRAMGRATRWAGGKIGRVPAYAGAAARLGTRDLQGGIVKLLDKEAKRSRTALSASELARLAEALSAVALGVLSGVTSIDEISSPEPADAGDEDRAPVAKGRVAPAPVAVVASEASRDKHAIMIRRAMLRIVHEDNLALWECHELAG